MGENIGPGGTGACYVGPLARDSRAERFGPWEPWPHSLIEFASKQAEGAIPEKAVLSCWELIPNKQGE